MCDSPLITATILKKRTEVIDVRDIGPIVTIHANGTRFVDNRNGGKPNAAPAGQTIKVLQLKIINKKARWERLCCQSVVRKQNAHHSDPEWPNDYNLSKRNALCLLSRQRHCSE